MPAPSSPPEEPRLRPIGHVRPLVRPGRRGLEAAGLDPGE